MSMIDRQPDNKTTLDQAREFWCSSEGQTLIENLVKKGYSIRYINILVFERMFANFAHLGEGERADIEGGLGQTTLAELQERYPALRD